MATTNAINYPGPLTNGQFVIGSTGAAPVNTTLTAGTGIAVTNGAGSITVATNGALLAANNLNDVASIPTSKANLNSVYFTVKLAANTTNSTGDGTQFVIPFDTIMAASTAGTAAFNTTTGIFTAPTTGLYCFSTAVSATSVAGATTGFLEFITTAGLIDYFVWQGTSVTSSSWGTAQNIYMTAGNTCKVNIRLAGTTKTLGFNKDYTYFSGYFIG